MTRLSLLGSILIIASPGTAGATIFYGTSGADELIVGCRNVTGGAAREVVVCVNGTFTQVSANDTCELNQDVDLRGEGDNDTVVAIRYDGQGLVCGSSTYYFNDFADGGYEITLRGGTGDDLVWSDLNETRTDGLDGADTVETWTTYTCAGGYGDDIVISHASSGADDIFGEAGSDCLQDDTGTWTTFDCGSGTDFWVDTPGTETGCEPGNEVDYCGFGR